MRIKGIQYPLIKHPQGFFHNAASDMAQIKADMAAIILTEPGERIFVPYFGTGLRKVNLHSPIEVVKDAMKIKIATSLKKWEKRVQVSDVGVDLIKDTRNGDKSFDNVLIVKISVLFLDPFNVKEIQSLIIYKSLGGIDGRLMPF